MYGKEPCRQHVRCRIPGRQHQTVSESKEVLVEPVLRCVYRWDAKQKTVTVTFNGHKKAVSSLSFDADGTRLASGSQDTDIILWDVIAETGMYRYAYDSLTLRPR